MQGFLLTWHPDKAAGMRVRKKIVHPRHEKTVELEKLRKQLREISKVDAVHYKSGLAAC